MMQSLPGQQGSGVLNAGKGRRYGLLMACFMLSLAWLSAHVQGAHAQSGVAAVLHIDGAIGPATAAYVEKGFAEAEEMDAAVIILRMDTPGGLDTAMRSIIRTILASPIPVAAYVSPSGARAASAGTYILYASHVAAMAPGTNLGAATPVQLGGGGLPFGEEEQPDEEDSADNGETPADASSAKAMNDAIAYIRSLAEMRDRNADWAEQAVRQAASLSADRAAAENVADFIATDYADLLQRADGRTVLAGSREVTLQTAGLEIRHVRPDWRSELLAVITDPNIALILMMIGIYGLIFEFMNPGAIVPGAVGGICLIIGLYALNALPVNYAGLALILLGIGLTIAEAFAPSFGILGLSGIAAFVLGAIILMDTQAPGFRIAWPAIAGVAAMGLLFTFVVAPFAVRSQRREVVSGREEMIGTQARVLDWQAGEGHVFVHGERWRARSSAPLKEDQTVFVTDLEGLTLIVAPDQPDNS